MHSALIHDWLVSIGGGEKVLEAMHRLYPSPIHTLVHDPKVFDGTYFHELDVRSSFIQRLPKAKRAYKNYLPLFPLAIEQFNLSEFDLILSSSHCVAKGVITNPDQLHICYCHTPMRYAWDLMHEYLAEAGLEKGFKGALVRFFLHYLRGWDVHSSKRVDHFIANSRYVARRIEKLYGREAEVIYPPVDLTFFEMREKKDNYYVAASRLVSYKKIDLVVEAFSQMPERKLVVIGDGPEREKIKKKAGPNIELMGYQPSAVLKEHLQRAKGFVFAALEDFGILPVEAMGCGTPVIAFGKGGLRESVKERETGLFFEEQSVPALIEAVGRFETVHWSAEACRKRAELFSLERFNRQLTTFVNQKYSAFKNRH